MKTQKEDSFVLLFMFVQIIELESEHIKHVSNFKNPKPFMAVMITHNKLPNHFCVLKVSSTGQFF